MWAGAVAGSIAYNFRKPGEKISVKIIHARCDTAPPPNIKLVIGEHAWNMNMKYGFWHLEYGVWSVNPDKRYYDYDTFSVAKSSPAITHEWLTLVESIDLARTCLRVR